MADPTQSQGQPGEAGCPCAPALLAAIPLPATLIDAWGLIADLNPAFLEMARRLGLQLRKEEWLGRPIASFASSEERKICLQNFVEEVLRTGEEQHLQWAWAPLAGRQVFFNIRGQAWRDSPGAVGGVLILWEEVTESLREARRQQALARIRDEVWRMQGEGDILNLLRTVHQELRSLELPFHECVINLLKTSTGVPAAYYFSPESQTLRKTRGEGWETLARLWQEGRLVYRRDLAAEDLYGEREQIERLYGCPIRSVVDVPFSHGTLAINSQQPDAFSEWDLEVLQAMAEILGRGFQRWEELQRLARSEEQYRTLVENGEMVVGLMDLKGHYLYLNPQVERFCGYSPTSFLADPNLLDSLIHPDDLSSLKQAFRQAVQSSSPTHVEYRWRGRDQSEYRWAIATFIPLWISQGKVRRVQVVAYDLTEVKQAQEKLLLQLSLQRLRQVIFQMQRQQDWEKVIWTFDQELRGWISFNACSINFIDFDRGTLTAYAVGPRLGVHKNERMSIEPPSLRAALKAAVETGRPLYRASRADPLFSSRIPAQVQAVLDIPFSRGTVAINSLQENAFGHRDFEILGEFAQVIAEGARRLEDLRALEEAEERFRQAQKLEAIGQLAGGIAHDFNNLLTGIINYSQLLALDLRPDDPRRQDLEEIHQAGLRGHQLVQQLLTFSRQQKVNPKVLDLNQLIADLEKMLGRLLGEDISLITRLEPNLGRVRADAGQLEQILINLAINARDAMPTGGQLIVQTANRTIASSERREGAEIAPGAYVVLAVRDTGIGMDREVQRHIFEPFFTTKEEGKGTGLGLAMVYGAVKQNHGFIWVDSEPGQGTTFEIYLPRVEAEIERETRFQPLAPRQGRGTVLVVEDEEPVRRVICRILSYGGYTVIETASGQEALQQAAAQGEKIELLITDVVMPGMNGPEVAKRLRATLPALKVLYLTGYSKTIAETQGELEPGALFLQKPFTTQELLGQIGRLLDHPSEEP